MTPRRPVALPTIALCPCPKKCGAVVVNMLIGQWRVISDCGFAGPVRYSKRTAREAWNRRSDAGAERRGATAAHDWMRLQFRTDDTDSEVSDAVFMLKKAIERGEVLPSTPEPLKKKARRT